MNRYSEAADLRQDGINWPAYENPILAVDKMGKALRPYKEQR